MTRSDMSPAQWRRRHGPPRTTPRETRPFCQNCGARGKPVTITYRGRPIYRVCEGCERRLSELLTVLERPLTPEQAMEPNPFIDMLTIKPCKT